MASATTETMSAAAPAEKPQRERGTLKETLPRRPIILIALTCIISAALGTAVFVYSIPTANDDDIINVTKLGFIAFLGSVSTSVGIIFGDSLSHVFAFGVTLLLVMGDIKSSIAAASPSLILAALASAKTPRSIISSLVSTFLLKPITLQACCLLPFLTLIHQSIVNPEYLGFSTIPICSVAFMTLALMYLYDKNKAHKNGCLLTTEMKSQAIFAGIAMLMSCSIAVESNSALAELTVYLLGSLFMLLISYFFASVADVWYTVGSGQFQMVSLDTAGIMLFFICPAAVLYLRFLDKYGESVGFKYAVLKEYLQSTGVLSAGDVYGEDIISFSLVMTLAMITLVGIPLLNALCPMGGFLFARAYTHGQPNTKKVALCVKFSDLPKDADKSTCIWDALEDKKAEGQTTAVLNVFVTLEDLMLYPSEVKAIAEKGHTIELMPSNFDEAICGLSMFQGIKPSCNVQIAHHEYSEMFGKEPRWLLASSTDSSGRHPSLLHDTKDLGMRVVYWSTVVQLGGGKLSSEQKGVINGDCMDKNGGSIIYVTLESNISSNSMPTVLCEVLNEIDGYSLESLSDVARDDATMVL